MSTLTIELKREKFEGSEAALPVEIIDQELTTVWHQSVALGSKAQVSDLSPGRYAIKVRLPSGETVTRYQELTNETVNAYADLYPLQSSPRESLEWATLAATPQVYRASRSSASTQLRSLWLRLWRKTDAGWQTEAFIDDIYFPIETAAQFELFLGGTLFYLQVGGESLPSRFVALPPENLRILITANDDASADGSLLPEAVEVSVSSTNQQAETLLKYLDKGAVKEARTVSQAVVAEELLYAKRANPPAAAVGSYYLLRVGELDRLHTWTENLANWTPWLPDGAVIRAWHLLQQENPDLAGVKQRLLEATKRGIPVYTEGLRLLYDGLVMVDDEAKGQDKEIRTALTTVKGFAATVDWYQPTTTFTGEHPNMPSRKVRAGFPEDETDVLKLREAE